MTARDLRAFALDLWRYTAAVEKARRAHYENLAHGIPNRPPCLVCGRQTEQASQAHVKCRKETA